jgi:hypothetical protein
MRNIILAITVFTLVSAAPAVAQGALWLRPGAKVRVTAPTLGLSEQVGSVQELKGDTLVLQVDAMRRGHLQADTLHVTVPAITKLDVGTGRRGHLLEGAGIGFLLGAVIGLASGDDPPAEGFLSSSYSAGEKAGALGVVIGSVGAIIGATHKSDKWAEVPIDQLRPRLIARDGGQVGVGVSLGF